MLTIPSTSDVELILKKYGAMNDFQKLIRKGVDRTELLRALSWRYLAKATWENLTGTSRQGFMRALRDVRSGADAIDRLARGQLDFHLFAERCVAQGMTPIDTTEIAQLLREYASQLELHSKIYGPKRKWGSHSWKAYVVAIVWESTGQPWDLQVAAIISAVQNGKKAYQVHAHEEWRRKHSELIELQRDFVRECHTTPLPDFPTICPI